ncbi:MAG: hypothetical protein ACLP50_16105 [Solirubrobacteraceae bacterium]
MSTTTSPPQARVLDRLDQIIGALEDLYRDLHSHPELSTQEHRTAAKAAEQLEQSGGFEVTTGVGGTGVVGVLRNGDGPTVMLRADKDALPVKEEAGLSYASTVTATAPDGRVTPVAHACGHDMHVTWLSGASTLLAHSLDAWHGTLIVAKAFRDYFGKDRVTELVDPLPVSEDFGSFGTEWGVPSLFWYVGGTEAELYRQAEKSGRVAEDVPTNHSSKFAPVLHPTLETGIQTLTTASLSYLGR